MRLHIRKIWIFAGALALLVTACGTSGAAKTTKSGPIKNLVVAVVGDTVDSLDPAQAQRPESTSIVDVVAQGLINLDPKTHDPVPSLAVSWKQTNPLTWQFNLRPDVKFSNGDPFNASVVLWNYQRIINPKVPSVFATNLQGVASVKVINNLTVDFITKAPSLGLPYLLEPIRFLSPPYVERIGDKAAGTHLVGTGPYMLDSWNQTTNEVTLSANPHYWGPKPAFPQVTFLNISEPATAVAELLTGKADIVTSIGLDQRSEIQGSHVAHVTSSDSLDTIDLRFDVMGRGGPNPFQKLDVRLAANYAVNKNAIYSKLFGGLGQVMGSYLNPLIKGYDSSIAPYPYDPQRAKQLLAAAGYPNGFTAVMNIYPFFADYQLLAQSIAAYLGAVGINVKLVTTGINQIGPLIQGGKASPMLLAPNQAGNSFDPGLAQFFILGGPDNPYSYYDNPAVAKLYNEAQSSLNSQQRLADFAQMQLIVHNDPADLFLGTQYELAGVSNKVNYEPSPEGQYNILAATPAG